VPGNAVVVDVLVLEREEAKDNLRGILSVMHEAYAQNASLAAWRAGAVSCACLFPTGVEHDLLQTFAGIGSRVTAGLLDKVDEDVVVPFHLRDSEGCRDLSAEVFDEPVRDVGACGRREVVEWHMSMPIAESDKKDPFDGVGDLGKVRDDL
jgi:hypothetical protein